jgi:hypothetical protein
MANVAGLALQTVAGNASAYPASNVRWQCPTNLLRYVRVQCLGEANGGDSSGTNFNASLVV